MFSPRSVRTRSRRAVVVALAVVALTAAPGLATPAHAAGTAYFVSPTGLDTNAGTSAGAPFKTIQHALDLAQPGTTITLAAGTYKEAAATKVAGAAGAPITVKGPETGKDPSGRYKAVLYSPAGRAFTVNHSYYTLDGFTIDGQPNIARTEYPTTLDAVRAWKDSVQARAINSKLVYVAASDAVSDLTGITISNMFLNGSGGECVRFRNRTSNSLVVGSVIQYCGIYGAGDDVTKYKYHNGEGVYVGTSPKSTTEPFAANDTSNTVVVRDSTVHTFGSECLEVKENAHHNRIENSDCGFNDEPLAWKGSNIELRGDHNLVTGTTVGQSRSWNVKMASDAPSYDLGGNSLQKSGFSAAAAPAIRSEQANTGSSFCGDTFASTPISEGATAASMGDPTQPCPDTTAPTAPTNLTAKAASSTSITLTWTAATDDVGVTGYGVLRNGVQVATGTATSFTDTGLTASTAYSYTVVARDAAGNTSPASNAASVTTAPPAPTALTATATSPTTVGLTWTAPANVAVASYGVLRNGTQVGTSTTTSYSDTGLTASTAYTYAVVAIDAAGAASPPSATASVTTAPPAPTALTAKATSSTTVALTWTAPANATVASYGVLRNGTQVATSTTTSFTDTALTPATAYTYAVVARDAAGNASPASTAATVTTAPPAPTALTAKATSSTTVALTWVAPASGTVASYGVLRNGTQVGTSTTTSFTDAGLTASTAYTYAVVAIDAAGATSPSSPTASVTTPAPTPPTAQVISVEAESGALTAPMAVGTDTKAQGGKYVAQTTGTSIGKDTITVNVTVAGKYAPALRVISPNGSSDSFTVSVDGGAATVWNLGTHTAWSWVTGSTLTLTAGQHKIVVSKRENGARLDTVRLTPVP